MTQPDGEVQVPITANRPNPYGSTALPTHHPRPTVAASTSFFGLPEALSSASLRAQLGLHAPPLGHVDWVSLAVIYWITLVSEASRGLMLPSTWPYFYSLGGSKQMLGVFVASFSMGRMATTIPLGYLSDKYPTSIVLSAASLIQIFGHLLYAVAPSLPVLFIARIIVGFGSATMSVCRAHVTRAIHSNIRTHHFAYLSATQFVGFAVLPGVGGLLALLPEYLPLPFLPLNGYTYPAYVLVFANFLGILLIHSFYFNPPPTRNANNIQFHSSQSDSSPFRPDTVALVVCLLVNVAFRGVVAEFETVSTPFLMEQYHISYGAASMYISVIGLFGLVVYLSFKPLAKRVSDRNLVVCGLLLVLVGCAPLSFVTLTTAMQISAYVFFLGFTWSVAYPIGQTAILALFSKVLASLPAGRFLGLFSATGSISRVLLAMLASLMWSELGRESVFAGILVYVSLATILVLVTYKRLIPPSDTNC